jgi:hypothetical protein
MRCGEFGSKATPCALVPWASVVLSIVTLLTMRVLPTPLRKAKWLRLMPESSTAMPTPVPSSPV